MTNKLLGLAAFLTGLSVILPWATVSGGVSYSTPFERTSTSSHGWIFPWNIVVETSITENRWSLYRGFEPRTRTETVSGSMPFQAVVTLCWVLGFVLVLAGFKYKGIAFIGGLISLASVGYFLSVLPSLNRSGSVISLFAIGFARASTEASIGCIPIVLGSVIAIIVGLYGFFATKDTEEGQKIVAGEPDARASLSPF